MNFQGIYLDIYTGNPEEVQDRYLAPTNGRTSNYVVNPGIEGKIVGVWFNIHADFVNQEAFTLIDVIPYNFAKETKIFESPEAEEMYPDEIDSLFILRISGTPGVEDGIRLKIKVNILSE